MEPKTTRRAGRGATVAGGLVILGVLFNSWLGKQLWFWLPGPLELPPAQPYLESFSNIWKEALNPYSQRWKIRAWRCGTLTIICGGLSGKIPGIEQELYLKMDTSQTLTVPVWLNVQRKSVSLQKLDWWEFQKTGTHLSLCNQSWFNLEPVVSNWLLVQQVTNYLYNSNHNNFNPG